MYIYLSSLSNHQSLEIATALCADDFAVGQLEKYSNLQVMGYRSLQLCAASARFVNLLQQLAKRERMRTATGSHLLPHASPDPPHYVDLAYFVSQESFAVDPYVHGVTIKQYCLNLANNSSSKLVTTLVDCHRPCRGPG